jgi:endo-1,4-beta-xylanase
MTRRLSRWRSPFAVMTVLGLIAPLALSSAPRALSASPTVVSSVDFNDGTTGTWSQDGSPTLSYVDDGSGGQALSILRAADYEGIQSPTGLLATGTTYTLSMRAMLPSDSPVTSTSVRFVVYSQVSGADHYDWVANTAIDTSGWTTVSGTYSLPTGADTSTAKVYIGSDNQTDASSNNLPYTIIVDDILITAPGTTPPPPTTVTISSVDFNDGTTGTWSQDGSPTLSYVDDGSGGQALSILRAADYEGIQSPTGLLATGTTYTLSMRAMLPSDSPVTSTSVRFVVYSQVSGADHYDWVANTAIDTSGWTTVSGTYSLPTGADTSTAKVYIGSDNQTDASSNNLPYTIIVDDILITAPGTTPPPPSTVISTDFESGLDGWVARNSQGSPTVSLTTDEYHSPTHAALVSNRTGQGDGIGHDVTGLMVPGTTYSITAWVKFAAGNPTDTLWLSMRRTNSGSDTYDTIAQFTGVPGDSWKQVTATYSMAAADSAFIYFETAYPDGTNAPFLVDDITIATQAGPTCDTSLTPLRSTVSFPVGVAMDTRETTGGYACTVLQHFNQLTAENSMKPEAWYDSNKNFRINPDAKALMDFAQANGIRVWGHTLVWHNQTPDWFFQHDDGTPLTNSDADKAILRTRLHDHIFNIAQTLSDMYGLFGSSTNPLVGFDVVNEVVSDGTTDPGGLRQSVWYNILGPEYIDDAFTWANQAFNQTYAAPGVTRPIKLAINDYNTEQSGKRQRLHDLVASLISRGIPVDIVGNQFHLSLSTPLQSVDDALTAFEDLPVKQDVSELDVPTGTPVTQALLVSQGYYYRDLFRIFRAHASDLFSVTVWGLYDGRSWRASSGAPLLFDDNLQGKPAYYGAIDGTLPPLILTGNIFQGSVPLDSSATSSMEWQKLPLFTFGDNDKVGFQARWESDHLTAYATIKDTTVDPTDAITFNVGGTNYTFGRSGTGDVPGVVSEVAGGWQAVVSIPLDNAQKGDQLSLDVVDTDGSDTVAWNSPGQMGTMTLVEPITFVDIAPTNVAPMIDGDGSDPVWNLANVVQTNIQVSGHGATSGSPSATADVIKTLWQDHTLYVFMHITDPTLDATASDPWQQDSVEIYVDNVNAKNGPYRPDDTQMRISYKNVHSFGTGDEAAQAARLVSATEVVPDGWQVEAAISLLDAGGVNQYIGLDFQVNDATNGSRNGIRNWADATNAGYLNTGHWGVGRLAPDKTVPVLSVPTPLYLTATAKDGYHGLTAAIAGVTASDAFDPASALTITSDAPAVLPIGTTVVTWRVTDAAGNSSTAQQTVVVSKRIPTWVLYLGPQVIVARNGSSATLGALLLTTSPKCWSGMPVTFSLNRNPITGAAGATLLGTGQTNRFGFAWLTVPTGDWQAGRYVLTVAYAGNNVGCLPSSMSVTISVAVARHWIAVGNAGSVAALTDDPAAMARREVLF